MTQPNASQPVQAQVATQPRVAAGAGLGMGRVGQAPASVPAPAKPGLGRKLAMVGVVALVGAAVVIRALTDPTSAPAPQVQVQVQTEVQAKVAAGWQPAVPIGAWREESGTAPNSPLLGFIATAGRLDIPGQVIAGNGSDLTNSVEHISGWQMVAINERGAGHAMGLRPGDIIVSYRGAPVTADSDTINAIHRSGTEHALDIIQVGIVRGGQRMVLSGPVGYATSFGALHP